MDHCQAHPCCIMKMCRISFPYDYLSSTSQGGRRRKLQEKTSFTPQKIKSKNKLIMRNITISEWVIILQCLVLVLDSFCGTSSIKAAAKHSGHQRKDLDDEAHLRLLSYLDNENEISLENLENLSTAKLIGHNKSGEEDDHNGNDNNMDNINQLLMMDDPVTSGDKPAPVIGKKS